MVLCVIETLQFDFFRNAKHPECSLDFRNTPTRQEAQHEERSKLKEETNKIGARMTIIMMIFMLPSLFMLIGGPAVLSILDAFQR